MLSSGMSHPASATPERLIPVQSELPPARNSIRATFATCFNIHKTSIDDEQPFFLAKVRYDETQRRTATLKPQELLWRI